MIPTAFPPPVPPSALIPQPIGPALASSAKSVAGKIQVIINKTHHPSRKQHQWLSELQVLAQRVAECTAETGREVAAERVQGCMELFERIKRFLEHAARVPTCTGARPLLASRSITLRFEGHKRKSKKTDQQDQKRKAANDQASILATLSRHRAVPTQMQVRSMGEKADEKRDEDLKDAQSLHLKFRVFDPAQALKVGDRGKKHEWVDRHTTPLFKADSLVNTRRRPDTVLVNKQLEGCAKLTWSSIFVFAEFTNAKVTLKQRNELHLKNLQAVLNGTTAFNAQSYRHYVLVLSFTKHDLFVFLLDRERVQAATISGWKEGDGFLDSCAVLHVLEHAEPTHLGFPPYLTLDERTNEPSSIDLGLLARLSNHHPSSMKYTSDIIRFPPPPSSKRPLPTIIPLSVVSPTRDSGPFERGTWVGGDGKGLFVKISSPARDRAGHEPTVLTKLHEQVEPSYLGHQIPELVGAFLEDPASTSAWRVDETLAEEYDDIIPRSTEILITRTPTGLKLLSELEPLPLLDAMLGHLEIIQALADAGVSQRDVAPDNARATEDGKATLLDFDHGVLLCRDADDGGDKAVKAGWAGTVATMAPDVLEAMATSPPDFYHRPHYDVISLVILFWYSVSKRVLGDTWASRDLSYRNALLATPTEPTTVEMEQKRKEAVGRKASEATTFEPEKGCSAKTILNMLAWDQGDPILASSARTNLWYSAPNSARAGLLNGMKNEMIKGALRKIMRADPLRRIVNVPTMPEVSEDHPMFEFYQKEQKRLETRFTEEALKAAIDSIRKVLIEARSTYDGKGWDGVALTQGK
ncbi:hypothetical protein MNV49_005757 [Pseudohyphozyma bogoriensis]|nr:hypothetical protein MNV49_005757 [Pseudohyphozyma bogoriensis]